MLSCEGCEQPTAVLVVWLEEGEISHLCMACFLAYAAAMVSAAQDRLGEGAPA